MSEAFSKTELHTAYTIAYERREFGILDSDMSLDFTLFAFLNQLAGINPWLDGIIVFLAHYSAYLLLFLFVIYFIISRFTRRKTLEMGLIALLAGLLGRTVLLPILHLVIQRPRPFISHDIMNLLFVPSYSFPSGHATFFFALSFIVYMYNKMLGKLFYATSILMVIGRVAAGVHYPSDILGGIILGTASAYILYKSLHYHHHRKHVRKHVHV